MPNFYGSRSPLRVVTLSVLLLVLLVSSAASAESMQSEYESLLRKAVQTDSRSLGLAWVDGATRIQRYIPSSVVRERLEESAEKARNPHVRFELVRALAQARHETRDYDHGYDGLEGTLGNEGCLVNWQVVGPFPNDNGEGFARQFGPELGDKGPFEGVLSEVEWRKLPREDRYCIMPISSSIQPASPAVVYLSKTIETPRRQRAQLHLGVNGAYKVWLNGEPVAQRRTDQGLRPDNDAWELKLNKGSNQLVMKIASSSDGALGAVARLTDTRSRPLNLDTDAAVPTGELAGDFAELDARNVGLLAELEANSAALEGDDAIWSAWLWQQANWQNVATPWRDVAERVLADPESLTPRVHALSAELYEEYWRKLDIVEQAHRRAPDDPWVAMALANTLDDSINETERLRARRVMADVTEKHPDFLHAWARLADWDIDRGFDERARQLLDSYKSENRMKTPAFFTRWVDLAETLGPRETLNDLHRAGLEFMAVSGSYWWDVINSHVAKNELDDALELVREYRKLAPASAHAAGKEAEILRAQGKLEEAIAIYDEEIRETPGASNLYQAKAQLLLTAGRSEDAIAALELALLMRPQDQQIRDYLSFLRPQEDRFWEPWMVADLHERSEQTRRGSFNYDTVVDQTIVKVSPNGLAQEVSQRVDRVLTADGIDSARAHRVSFQMGDERVDILRVRVYKADGTISEDFDQWQSGGSRKGSTTYNDTGYVNVRANNVGVGDLVEVRWRMSQVANSNFRGDYFGDIAYLQGGRPIGFERYAVIYPADWNLYFRPPALPHDKVENTYPDGREASGVKITSFEMKNVPHVETDPGQPGATDVYDYILVSNKQTYDEIGQWWWSLIEEQLITDEAIKSKVQELVAGKSTDDEKIQAIHNYVVKNTRYLHVGLGIHGWKPYRTTTAFRNRYGDCKDKAALLKVMLEEAGIDASMVLVRTRRLGTVDSFPASMHVFNHAITYVPSKDLYLDGTAEFNGTQELTSMDQGAQALVVKDGGKTKFLQLPVDKPEANLLKTKLAIDLTGEEPVARGSIEAHGANAVYLRSSLEDPERRDEVLEKQLAGDYPGAKLVSAKYENLDDLEAPTRITFAFKSEQLLRRDGAREFLLPMAENKDLIGAYARQSTRTQDLTIRVPFANETTVKYTLATDRVFDRIPEPVELKSKFGSLEIAYRPDGQSLEVSVRYSIDVQRVAVEDYDEFRSFLSKATDALDQTIGLAEEK